MLFAGLLPSATERYAYADIEPCAWPAVKETTIAHHPRGKVISDG